LDPFLLERRVANQYDSGHAQALRRCHPICLTVFMLIGDEPSRGCFDALNPTRRATLKATPSLTRANPALLLCTLSLAPSEYEIWLVLVVGPDSRPAGTYWTYQQAETAGPVGGTRRRLTILRRAAIEVQRTAAKAQIQVARRPFVIGIVLYCSSQRQRMGMGMACITPGSLNRHTIFQ
jgi:hypothetical protein